MTDLSDAPPSRDLIRRALQILDDFADETDDDARLPNLDELHQRAVASNTPEPYDP